MRFLAQLRNARTRSAMTTASERVAAISAASSRAPGSAWCAYIHVYPLQPIGDRPLKERLAAPTGRRAGRGRGLAREVGTGTQQRLDDLRFVVRLDGDQRDPRTQQYFEIAVHDWSV